MKIEIIAGDSPSASRPPAMLGPPRWVERWVGRAFDAEDRDPGCHCWGLVRRVLEAERGVLLPRYSEISAAQLVAAARRFAADSGAGPWIPVAGEPQAFDVALLTAVSAGELRSLPVHCGIVVAAGLLLHVEAATSAVVVPLSHWSVRHRLRGFFRHSLSASGDSPSASRPPDADGWTHS